MEPPELSQRPQGKGMVERLEEEVKSLKSALAAKNKVHSSPYHRDAREGGAENGAWVFGTVSEASYSRGTAPQIRNAIQSLVVSIAA